MTTYRELGYEAVMVNCNPETVSTDYDTSDRLYFEPLDAESVLAICEREKPDGVVIQFGGQTPLKLARAIEDAGYRILGTPFDAVDLAEDRERFAGLLLGARAALAGVGDRRDRPTRPSRSPSGSATRCSSGPRTSSAAARCASVTRPTTSARCRRSTGSSSTGSSRTRSRSTSTRSATAWTRTSRRSCSTSRRRASTPATRPASCRRRASRSRKRRRSRGSCGSSAARSASSASSTSSSRSRATATSTCSRRTRARRGRCRS